MNVLLRLQNKATLMALISGALLIIKTILEANGIGFDLGAVNVVIDTVLGILVALGVVIDPTTPGIKDSTVSLEKTDISQTAEEIVKGF